MSKSAANSDLSPYAMKAILGNAGLKAKMLQKLEYDILQYEMIVSKNYLILKDYPELSILMDMLPKLRMDAEKLHQQLTA